MKLKIHLKHLYIVTIVVFLLVPIMSLLFTKCKPDQQGPTDNYCTSGQSVLTIDDSNVTSALKNKIYASGPVINTQHPDYNKNGKTVIIPFEATDKPFNTALTTQVIRDAFFTTGVGSVADFYSENSWGQFKVTEGGISSPVDLNRPYTDYTLAESDPTLMRDLCQKSSINWAALDVNADHEITPNEAQVIFIIPDGGSGATRKPNNVFSNYPYDYITIETPAWSGKIRNSFVMVGCKKNGDPATNPLEYNYSTIWHELGHAFFNLPDRYTSYCGTGLTGAYDLMSDNCSKKHLEVYDKMRIGWIKPKITYSNFSANTDYTPYGTNLQSGLCLNMAAIESQPTALIHWVATAPDEFWIMENKEKSSSIKGFEDGLPESGLAVWWVDMTNSNIALVDASKGSLVPTNYNNQGTGALLKYPGQPSQSAFDFIFYDKSDKVAFTLRSISPAGTNMYFSF